MQNVQYDRLLKQELGIKILPALTIYASHIAFYRYFTT